MTLEKKLVDYPEIVVPNSVFEITIVPTINQPPVFTEELNVFHVVFKLTEGSEAEVKEQQDVEVTKLVDFEVARDGPEIAPRRSPGVGAPHLGREDGRAFARTRDERLLRARLCSQRWEANL